MGWFPLRPWKSECHFTKIKYLPELIDESVKEYLSKKVINMPNETKPSNTKENIRYFELPSIVIFSKFTKNKLWKLTFKLGSPFSTKNKFPYVFLW